jgi:hypothetical protein
MTAITGVESLDGALAAIHDRWVARLAAVLSPAMAPRSRHWERREVIRRFAEELQRWLQMEFAVVESLGGRLPPDARVRLATLQEAVERTATELLSSTALLAILSRRLLELTRLWCAELEWVTRGLTTDDLSQPCRAMLERMGR